MHASTRGLAKSYCASLLEKMVDLFIFPLAMRPLTCNAYRAENATNIVTKIYIEKCTCFGVGGVDESSSCTMCF